MRTRGTGKTRSTLPARILSVVGRALLAAGIGLNALALVPAVYFAVMTGQYTAVVTVTLLSALCWAALVLGVRAWIRSHRTRFSTTVVPRER